MNNLVKPKIFVLQWHITERCNWHCRHCYQTEHPVPDLTLKQLFQIFDQFLFLLKKWHLLPGRTSLNITGGEPFLREDLFQLLEKVAAKSCFFGYRWTLMTNGSLLTEGGLKKLKAMGINAIQVSLEGLEKHNDEIRGEGSFGKIIESLRLLVKANISSIVSLTLTKKNQGDVPALVKLLDKLGVHAFGTRRLIPWERGKTLGKYMLQPRELKTYALKLREINKKLLEKKKILRVGIGCESSILNEDLLINPEPGMQTNLCGVTQGRCLTVMANGDILPCRRFPIVVGNALKDSIYDVYYSQPMQDFRNLDKLHPFCQGCSNFINCFGGAKCVTYAHTGRWDIPDVQCWRAYKKLNEPNF